MIQRQFLAGRDPVELSVYCLVVQNTKTVLIFVQKFSNRGNSVPEMHGDRHTRVKRSEDLMRCCGLGELQYSSEFNYHVSCTTQIKLSFVGATVFCCLIVSCLFIHIITLPPESTVASLRQPPVFIHVLANT